MKIIKQLKLRYHLFKVAKAIKNRNKAQYDKHTKMIQDLLWNTLMGA